MAQGPRLCKALSCRDEEETLPPDGVQVETDILLQRPEVGMQSAGIPLGREGQAAPVPPPPTVSPENTAEPV